MCYDRVDLSEEIDSAKIDNSKLCIVCHYWYFNQGFTFQSSVCNSCHDLKMFSLNLSGIALITVKGVHYCCIIYNISKSEAIHLLKNVFQNHEYI